jgi:endoglycosylceramidase
VDRDREREAQLRAADALMRRPRRLELARGLGRTAATTVAAFAAFAALGAAGAAAASLPAVHAAPDREMRDSHERQVLLRGINVTALTDQYQVNRRLPTVVPLRRRDYRQMEAFGFNVIRLAVNWSKLEPQRGRISNTYLQQIAKVVQRAAGHGMYTVIDMHNSGWGKDVDTPPGASCPAGLRPSHGWMGAPGWATFTGGETTCHDDKTTKRTPAIKTAWFNFWTNHAEPSWADGLGIQDHLVDVWGAIGRRFANDPAVAGYDLLNEADPGGVPHKALSGYDGRFDAAAIDAIRQGESAAGGFSHMAIFEPNLTWTSHGLKSHTPAPGFSSDPNLVFSAHLYGRDVHTTVRPIEAVKKDLRKQARLTGARAREYGVPLWIGEWSFSPFDQDAFKKLRAHIRLQDSRVLGSAWWQWKVACGLPQRFDGLDPTASHQPMGNINLVKCPSGKPLRRPGGWKSIIARAYPRYAPGTITHLSARGARLSLAGKSNCNGALRASDPQACKLVVWIPKTKKHRKHPKHRGKRPKVEGRHMKRVRVREVHGGWIATATVGGGRYSLHTR